MKRANDYNHIIYAVKNTVGDSKPTIQRNTDGSLPAVWKSCTRKNCITCEQRHELQDIVASHTGKRYFAIEGEVSCKTKNVIYAITCNKCNIHYVGETCQEIKRRFMQHRSDVIKGLKNTFLVKHFSEANHAWTDMRITVLDKISEERDKPKLRDMEINWIKILTSAHPFGLNDSIKGYGNVSEWDLNNPMHGKNCPYFMVPVERKGKRKSRGKKRRRSKVTDDQFLEKIKALQLNKDYNAIYQALKQASKKTLKVAVQDAQNMTDDKELRLLISGYCIGYFDTGKQTDVKKKRMEGVSVKLDYVSNKISEMNVQSYMNKTRNKAILGYNQETSACFKKAKVIYNYGIPIGRKICNYKSFIKGLTDEELEGQAEPVCKCSDKYSDYIALDGHVVSGDMNIVKDNMYLRNLMNKGANYRIDRNFLTMDDLQNYRISIREYAEKVYCRDDLSDRERDVETYVERILYYVSRNVEIRSTYEGTPNLKSDSLRDLICVPVDKASNNFAFICKALYLRMIRKELNIDNPGIQRTYQNADVSKLHLIARHKQLCSYYDLSLQSVNEDLPALFATAKLHKSPIKLRYIAGASKSSMKPLSILAHNMLTALKVHFKRYCTVIEARTHEKRYISVNNSRRVVNIINANVKSFQNIKTYDFSTLYTKLPHEDVIKCLFFLVDLLFRNNGKTYLLVNREVTKFGVSAFYSNEDCNSKKRIALDKTAAKELICAVVEESYVEIGNKIFKQVAGIPMGGNASPLVADLVLSIMEYRYFEREDVNIGSNSVICRYIDDILAVNVDVSHMITKAYAKELQINEETGQNGCVTYLDLKFDLQNNKILPYNKTDVFDFNVIRAYHEDSCVPKRLIIGVIVGNLHRICNSASMLPDFLAEISNYISILTNRGHCKANIVEGILKFVARFNQTLWKYRLFDKKDVKAKLIGPLVKNI